MTERSKLLRKPQFPMPSILKLESELGWLVGEEAKLTGLPRVLLTVLGTKNGYGLPGGVEESPLLVLPLVTLLYPFVSAMEFTTPFFVAIVIVDCVIVGFRVYRGTLKCNLEV